jgi:hypothetical protein
VDIYFIASMYSSFEATIFEVTCHPKRKDLPKNTVRLKYTSFASEEKRVHSISTIEEYTTGALFRFGFAKVAKYKNFASLTDCLQKPLQLLQKFRKKRCNKLQKQLEKVLIRKNTGFYVDFAGSKP